ncbi:imidazole glycerol phosphate synthase subunit HisF [Sulfitobacter sp. JL08]|uniref:AglZ/HisF2 family acetamidino modification protein n=1 Tax=Sulfitobacter sp. JL08 TaxID=2070369 RepID=UPI000E0B2219|nr:AglZ/HisF2 family acetamidino modification protein [Sulfitobacter sp. JL08]AXI54105.1 imidazole glycerol phosphate synthase subunit HisF [Sulfitobacter sp. JL08]
MKRIRVIPTLTMEERRLVKTLKFGKRTYVGDPINTVKLFNDKEVDEILLLDIGKDRGPKGPDIEYLRELTSECFVPLGYGGGIRTLDHAKAVFAAGVEKVSLNTALFDTEKLVGEIAQVYGSQAVLASIDVRLGGFLLGRDHVLTDAGQRKVKSDPVEVAKRAVELGAGEILITAVDRDGTMEGYDTALIRRISEAVSVPVIANGGASSISDLLLAVRDGGASAVAAGAFFVFKGPHRAVLVNYPRQEALRSQLFEPASTL